MEWSVLVETEAPEGADVDEDELFAQFGELTDALADHGAAVGGDRRGWDVRLNIETAAGPLAAAYAVDAGAPLVFEYAEKVGLPLWPVVRTEAREINTFHAELEVSNFPAVLGTTEVTKVLGVSRQRLHELRAAGRFPEPIAELAATPLWIRSTVDSFLAGWKRKPGRPVNWLRVLMEGGQVDNIHALWFKRDSDHGSLGTAGIQFEQDDEPQQQHTTSTSEKTVREFARRYHLFAEHSLPNGTIVWERGNADAPSKEARP